MPATHVRQRRAVVRIVARLAAGLAALAVGACGGSGGGGPSSASDRVTTLKQTTTVEVFKRAGGGGGFDPQSIYKREAPGVVTVLSVLGDGSGALGGSDGSGLGSGFVLNGRGEIATNAHVVNEG